MADLGGADMTNNTIQWWSRNDQGFWCDFCGDCLKPSFHFDSDEDADEFESGLGQGNCRNCGAPDAFDMEFLT